MKIYKIRHLVGFVFFCSLSLVTLGVSGQSISRRDANNLIASLGQTNLADTSRLNSLIKLAQFNIFKPGEFKVDLDSAEMYIKKASRLNGKVKSREIQGLLLLMECHLAVERTNTHGKKEDAYKAIQIFQATNDRFNQAVAYIELIRCFDAKKPADLIEIKNLNEKALLLLNVAGNWRLKEWALMEMTNCYPDLESEAIFLNHVAAYYRRLNNKSNELFARQILAETHFLEGKKQLAIEELMRVLNEFHGISYPGIYSTYDMIGSFYFKTGNYPKALFYSLETLKSLHTAADSERFVEYCGHLNYVYSVFGMTQQNIGREKELVNFLIENAQFNDFYYYAGDVSMLLLRLGQPQEALSYILDKRRKYPPTIDQQKIRLDQVIGRCYYDLGKNNLAVKYFKEMAALQVIAKNDQLNPINYYYIGMSYFATKQYAPAKKYLIEALINWKKEKTTKSNSDIYKALYKIDSTSGNYLSALKYSVKYKNAYDSVDNLSNNIGVQKLQIAYETEQKKKDIVLLKSNQKLQMLKLQQIENTRNWIIAIALMLLLLLSISYNRYRLKRRSNELLQIKQQENVIANSNLQRVISQKERLLNEKEWLLKEVHHRVKNNLHTVICLLESQAAYLKGDALEAIENSEHRIYAMSLIHQKLYQSEDIKTIDISVYLREFINYLSESFGIRNQINFELEIEPLKLGVAQAIPITLIINEAVTNSIKYAFPTRKTGKISIKLHENNEGIELIIADNGLGIDKDILDKPSESLGIKLMKGLTEDINGIISFDNNKGTEITIKFNLDPLIFDEYLLPDIKEDSFL